MPAKERPSGRQPGESVQEAQDREAQEAIVEAQETAFYSAVMARTGWGREQAELNVGRLRERGDFFDEEGRWTLDGGGWPVVLKGWVGENEPLVPGAGERRAAREPAPDNMPLMALATVDQVKEMGQLTTFLFDYTLELDLDAHVQRWIDVADLHIQGKAGAFYTSTDPVVIGNLTMGEVFLSLADLIGQLGAKKVYGTHAPIDSEDSESYFGNLEEFYRQRAMEFLDDYFVLEDPDSAFAAPAFLIGQPEDWWLTQTIPETIADWLDESKGMPGVTR